MPLDKNAMIYFVCNLLYGLLKIYSMCLYDILTIFVGNCQWSIKMCYCSSHSSTVCLLTADNVLISSCLQVVVYTNCYYDYQLIVVSDSAAIYSCELVNYPV